MSLVSPYRPFSEVNDFYESLQNIQDSFEASENFGKHISDYSQFKNVKKVYSYNNLTANMSFDEGARKCFSTTSFQQNELELQNYYGKSPFGYQLEDQSTMASFSSINSFNSHSSVVSTPNVLTSANNNTVNNNNKGKVKGNGGKKKKTGDVDYRKKYKTEVCKNWTEKGFCDFGDQCAFAHGNEEVRQKCHISSNYKTKKCIQFHETGYCPYGGRCQFIHSLRKERQLDCKGEMVPYMEAMENPEIYITHDPDCVCMQKKTRRRLPSFQLVTDIISPNSEIRGDDSTSEKDNEIFAETNSV